MPFITLNNNWSSLAQYYNNTNNNGNFAGTANVPNVTNTQKPTIPKDIEQFKLSDDGLIRGGAQNALLATTKDVIRIGKFIIPSSKAEPVVGDTGYERFLDKNKGFLFFTKQILLQRANPKLEKNRGSILGGIAGILGGPTRTYTGVGMLASVAGNTFGLHFDRAGALGIIPDNQKYGGDIDSPTSGVVYSNNFKDKESNLTITEKSHNRLLEYTAKLFDNTSNNNEVVLDSYLGGPNSLYGIIGRTRTKSYFDKTFLNQSDITRLGPRLNGFTPLTSKEIAVQKTAETNSTGDYINLGTIVSPLYKNLTNNIESKLGVSTPTNVDSINVINIVNSKVFYYDNLNKKTTEAVSTGAVNDYSSKAPNGDFGKDLVKFRIEFLNNDETGVLVDKQYIVNTDVLAFRAYLDSFDDGINAKWNSYRYMGRGEEFYIYDGFTRDIGVSFTMFAHSLSELRPIYDKLNYLISTFTPDYSSQLKMRGNIGYLTVGDYLYRQPGVFTDIKLSGFFDGPWNVGLTSNNDNQNFSQYYNGKFGDGELPMMLKVGLSFKPIHTFLPRKGSRTTYVPFIGRDTIAYPIKNSSPSTSTTNPGSNGTTPSTQQNNQTAASQAPTLDKVATPPKKKYKTSVF